MENYIQWLFIDCLFVIYLFSNYCVSTTALGARETEVNKTDKIPALTKLSF